MSVLYRFRGETEQILEALAPFRAAGHTLFFVFDGKPPTEKEPEVQARKKAKEVAGAQALAIEEFLQTEAAAAMAPRDREILETSLARAKSGAWHMTRDARRAFQERLWIEKIPYVKSVSEADDVLADLAAAGKLDVIISTDMDCLLSGVERLWIPVKKGMTLFEEISLADVLEGEGLTMDAFRDACLLCGTEERSGAKGVPAHTAFAWMRHYGSLDALLRSNVTDRAFREMFPGAESISAARSALSALEAYGRIRPDHLERTREFLDGL
jgi:5'-3' exonuclease